jgi:hypothetical protein
MYRPRPSSLNGLLRLAARLFARSHLVVGDSSALLALHPCDLFASFVSACPAPPTPAPAAAAAAAGAATATGASGSTGACGTTTGGKLANLPAARAASGSTVLVAGGASAGGAVGSSTTVRATPPGAGFRTRLRTLSEPNACSCAPAFSFTSTADRPPEQTVGAPQAVVYAAHVISHGAV